MSVPPPLTPDRQQVVDSEHLRLLSIFHFVGAGFAAAALVFLGLHFLLMHTVLTQAVATPRNQPPFPVFIFFGIFYAIGAFWLVGSLILNLVAAFCLRNRKSRIFCMFVGAINCLHIPFGTVLGVFTLVVLSRPSVRDAFAQNEAPL